MHYLSNLLLIKNSTCCGQIYCPSSGVSTLYPDLASRQSTQLALQMHIAAYSVLRFLTMDSRCLKHVEFFIKNKFEK